MTRSHAHIESAALLGLVLMVGACETSVNIEFPTHAPLIMINSFFWPDAEFELYLGEAVSLATGEDNIRCIEDGTVELWEGDQKIETLPHVGDCLYRSASNRPVPGVAYTIRASAPGYQGVEATDTSPRPVPTVFKYDVKGGGPGIGRIDVTITLTDPTDIQNWYRIMVFYRYEDEEGNIWFDAPRFKTDDEAIIAENQDFLDIDENGGFETVFFTDTRIPPGDHRIHIEVPVPWDGRFASVDLVVFMDGISKHFYDYGTTYRIQRQIGDNPFAEPVQVTTNVEHGFGIFGGFNRRRLDVQIE